MLFPLEAWEIACTQSSLCSAEKEARNPFTVLQILPPFCPVFTPSLNRESELLVQTKVTQKHAKGEITLQRYASREEKKGTITSVLTLEISKDIQTFHTETKHLSQPPSTSSGPFSPCLLHPPPYLIFEQLRLFNSHVQATSYKNANVCSIPKSHRLIWPCTGDCM